MYSIGHQEKEQKEDNSSKNPEQKEIPKKRVNLHRNKAQRVLFTNWFMKAINQKRYLITLLIFSKRSFNVQ